MLFRMFVELLVNFASTREACVPLQWFCSEYILYHLVCVKNPFDSSCCNLLYGELRVRISRSRAAGFTL